MILSLLIFLYDYLIKSWTKILDSTLRELEIMTLNQIRIHRVFMLQGWLVKFLLHPTSFLVNLWLLDLLFGQLISFISHLNEVIPGFLMQTHLIQKFVSFHGENCTFMRGATNWGRIVSIVEDILMAQKVAFTCHSNSYVNQVGPSFNLHFYFIATFLLFSKLLMSSKDFKISVLHDVNVLSFFSLGVDQMISFVFFWNQLVH